MAMKLVTAAAVVGMALGMPATPQRSESAALASKKSAEAQTMPNIVTVMIDDLGWNDVGWHDEKFATPTMSSLAETGVVLERFYTAPTCTPSRSQFMTGRYNIRTGMQDSVIHSTEPRGTRQANHPERGDGQRLGGTVKGIPRQICGSCANVRGTTSD